MSIGPARVLFSGSDAEWGEYRDALPRALAAAGVAADLSRDHPPGAVDWIVHSPAGPVSDFAPFVRLKGVLSLWAGVERIVGNPTLRVPLARMVDEGLTAGMVEWVTGHVLRHHLGIDAHVLRQDGVWRHRAPKLARDRRVTVLGLGALGLACARALAGLGFPVTGWSRRPKADAALARSLSGWDGLEAGLADAEAVVLLTPLTAETEDLLDARRLGLLARGAFVLNPGRGPLVDDDALLAALDAGQVGHATLDVFRTEPLPPAHPFWSHPGVTVTPHIAAETRPESAARVIAENLRRGEAGEPLLHLVDRAAGY